MKTAFILFVLLHGLIHVLGFVKGFELSEIKALTLPISKMQGLAWFIAALLVMSYGVLHALNFNYAWLMGIIAVLVSQGLILWFWKDAKFATLPNVLILGVSLLLLGHWHFQQSIREEVAALLEKNHSTENRLVKEADLSALPNPVQNWLRHSGVIGKPFIQYGKVSQTAELQMKPEQAYWMKAKAIQYTTLVRPGFIWSVDVKMNSLLSFQGRDKLDEGKGDMVIKLNSVFSIVDERGEKLDESTLQRYLGEMVWFPSLALSPYIDWEPIDEHTAKASMSYQGSSGSGTFHFNAKGEVTKFSALRYKGNEAEAKRYNWEMNILDYKTFEGIKVPAKMTSTWKLDSSDWTWLKLEVTDIQYNGQSEK